MGHFTVEGRAPGRAAALCTAGFAWGWGADTHVLYYLVGMLAIGAASLFATLAVEALGRGALLGLSLLDALFAVMVAAQLERRSFSAPDGIFGTLAVALTPLPVYALQHVLGFWADGANAQHYRDFHRWIDWRWLLILRRAVDDRFGPAVGKAGLSGASFRGGVRRRGAGRRMCAVFGDLSWGLFSNGFAFVAVPTVLGFALIDAGLWWSRHEAASSARLRAVLPETVRELLERRCA